MFDELLRRLGLEDDDALSRRLDIGYGILQSVRRHDAALGASLLIRISERCGITVAELRRLTGDRRADVRLDDIDRGAREPGAGIRVAKAQAGLVRDDPGLPANVQWS